MRRLLFILISFLITNCSNNRNIKVLEIMKDDAFCNNFRKGTFEIITNKKKKLAKVFRNDSVQIEVNDDKGYEIHETIEWLDDCNYILKYDGSKMELTDSQSYVNDNGGLKVEIIGKEDHCLLYRAYLKNISNGQIIQSKICVR